MIFRIINFCLPNLIQVNKSFFALHGLEYIQLWHWLIINVWWLALLVFHISWHCPFNKASQYVKSWNCLKRNCIIIQNNHITISCYGNPWLVLGESDAMFLMESYLPPTKLLVTNVVEYARLTAMSAITSLCFEDGVLACEDPSLLGLVGPPSFFFSGPFSRGERSPFKGDPGYKWEKKIIQFCVTAKACIW